MELKIFTEHEKQSLLKDARKIVVEAGKITNSYFKRRLIIENKQENAFNPVTVADKLTEKKMREMLEKLYPDDAIVGGYDASQYESKRLWTKSRDGVNIPMSVVYKKGIKL